MTFKELLIEKNVTGYGLAKSAGIPYTTISDLINGKTVIQNVSLKHAIMIADVLSVDVKFLNELNSYTPIEFRYFRNNLLNDLKNAKSLDFAKRLIKTKEIDFYYKNNAKPYAYYLLALVDYLYRKNGLSIFIDRYNEMRREKLEKPFFVGSDLISFETIEEAERKLQIKTIPEFKKFNIIEEDVFNVA